jgi:membrane protein
VQTKSFVANVRELIDLTRARQLPFLAAAIAYYAFLSVVPLLIVGLTIGSIVAGETLAERAVASFGEYLTPQATDLLEQTLVDGQGQGGVTAIGLAVLMWGALRVFRGLDIAFGRIYGFEDVKPFLEQLRDAVLVFGGIVLAIAATVAVTVVLAALDIPFAGLLSTVGLLVVLTAVFFPLYFIFPGQPMRIGQALPGAIFASVGWTLLGTVFGLYAANTGSSQLYGVLGGVLLLLVWFYFGGLIILLGAAVNVVLDEDRQLQQGPLREGAQRATMSEADGPTDDSADDSAGEEDAAGEEGAADEAAGGDTPPDTTGATGGTGSTDAADREPTGRADPEVSARVSQEDIDDLRRELDRLEERLDDKTVHRDEIESDLKQYVRSRVRRGHAIGWGPYLVLLYGTAMTLGAFFFLGSGWAILAMLIIWLSTLGLYALMLIVGLTVKGVAMPGKILDKIRSLR